MKNYGKELILDLHDCDPSTFTRRSIKEFFKELCELIDMEREKLVWWDYKGLPKEYAIAPPHLKGISAVQFIKTSNITVHTLEELKRIYINIFSCKTFKESDVWEFAKKWFKGTIVNFAVVNRT